MYVSWYTKWVSKENGNLSQWKRKNKKKANENGKQSYIT